MWKLVEGYEEELLGAVPTITDLVEDRLGGFLRSHNLTQVTRELENLAMGLGLLGSCSEVSMGRGLLVSC